MDDYAYQGQPYVPPPADTGDYAYQGQPFVLYQKPESDPGAFFELF